MNVEENVEWKNMKYSTKVKGVKVGQSVLRVCRKFIFNHNYELISY